MKHLNSNTSNRFVGKIFALLAMLCLLAMPFSAMAQTAENPYGLTVENGEFQKNQDGVFAAKTLLYHAPETGDGLRFYGLGLDAHLADSTGITISEILLKDSVASVFTVQALDAMGEPMGDQKTWMAGYPFAMPEGSVGFMLKIYGDGADFRLLQENYAGCTVEMTLLAEEGAASGMLEVLLSGEKRDAAGQVVETLEGEPALLPLPLVPGQEDASAAAEEKPVVDIPVMESADPADEAPAEEAAQPEATAEPTLEPTPEPTPELVVGRIAMPSCGIPQGTAVALAAQDQQLTVEAWEDGSFAFEQLPAGEYNVFISLPEGMAFSAGDVWQLTDQGDMIWTAVTLAEGEELLLPEVTFETSCTLSFTAFSDRKRTGKMTEDAKGIAGVKVEIMDGETVLASGLTDENGQLTLEGVAPGSHTLRVTGTDGYCPTVKGENSSVEGGNGYVAISDPIDFTSGHPVVAGAGMELLGSLGGRVFEDMNNDGLMDEDEPGVAGVVIRLEGLTSGNIYHFTTDETGVYSFGGLIKEKFSITASLPEGCLYARYSKTGGDLRSIFTGSTLEREFRVGRQEQVGNKNIGVIQNGTLTGMVFMDLNYNGVLDEGEPGAAGITLEAIKVSNDESYGKVVSDENGQYTLSGLRSGDYRLRAILPDDGSEFTVVPENAAENVEISNQFVQRDGRRENSVQPIDVQSGTTVTVPVGVAMGATIRGTVFTDENYDGQYTSDEKDISGIEVYAVDENGMVHDKSTTNKDGQYALHGLMPGNYVIKFQRVAGNGFTRLRPELEGGSHVVELLDGFGQTAPMELSMSQVVENVNAGMLPSATVTGRFFKDLNDNGFQDDGEAGMVGVNVRLLSQDGEIDLVRPVEEDGTYFFDGVMPGTYTLTYQLPEHAELAQVAQGGNTLEHQGRETVSESFTIVMGDDHVRPLVGGVELGSLEGTVFVDTNANGLMDDGETALSGAAVKLLPEGGDERVATSDASGYYFIRDLRPGNYQICVDLPEGYILSREVEGLAFAPENQQTLDCNWDILVGRQQLLLGGVKPATISGAIWLDENKDGSRAAEEALLTGLTLNLIDENTGLVADTLLTSETGFVFENVRPGSYSVSFMMPEQSESADDPASGFRFFEGEMKQEGITVAEGETRSDLTAGLVSRTSIAGSLTLRVGEENNAVAGAEISLWQEGASSALAVTETDEFGHYQFDGLWPGQYQIKSELPLGMIFVRPDDPNYPAGASTITTWDTESGTSDVFTLEMAKHQLNRNILFIVPAKIGDQVWLDENQNGLIDGGEQFIPGVTIRLISGGEVAYETTSDAFGYYLFGQVYPGTYTLEAEAYPSMTITTPVPGLEIISSALISGDGSKAYTAEMNAVSGSENKNVNLGYILLPGQKMPVFAAPDQRDWTVAQEKYVIVATQDWENVYDPNK